MMVALDEKKRCSLEHHFRSVKLESENAKLQIEKIMELVVGEMLMVKFLPPDVFSEKHPITERFLGEVLKILKAISDRIESFINCNTSESYYSSEIEREKLHPSDFLEASKLSDCSAEVHFPVSVSSTREQPLLQQMNNGSKQPFLQKMNNASEQPFLQQMNNASEQPFLQQMNNASEQPFLQQMNNVSEQPFLQQINNASEQPFLQQMNNGSEQPFLQQMNSGSEQPFLQQMNNGSEQPFLQQVNNGSYVNIETPVNVCPDVNWISVSSEAVSEKDKLYMNSYPNHCYYLQSPIPTVIPMTVTSQCHHLPIPTCLSPIPESGVLSSFSTVPNHDEGQFGSFKKPQEIMNEDACQKEVVANANTPELLPFHNGTEKSISQYELGPFQNVTEKNIPCYELKLVQNGGEKSIPPYELESFQNGIEVCNPLYDTSAKPGDFRNCTDDYSGAISSLTEKFSNNSLNLSPDVPAASTVDFNGQNLEVQKVHCTDDRNKLKLLSPHDIMNSIQSPELQNEWHENIHIESNSDGSSSDCSLLYSESDDSVSSIGREHNHTEYEKDSQSAKGGGRGMIEDSFSSTKPSHVYLSFMKPPNYVWVQMADCSVLKLQDRIDKLIEEQGIINVCNLHVGLMVAARYELDGCYYRAFITDWDQGSEVDVFFTDYGNSERVRKEELSLLPKELMDIPAFAFPCVLTHMNGMEIDLGKGDSNTDLLAELQKFIVNAVPLTAVFTELPADVNYNALSFICPKYAIRLCSYSSGSVPEVDLTNQSKQYSQDQESTLITAAIDSTNQVIITPPHKVESVSKQDSETKSNQVNSSELEAQRQNITKVQFTCSKTKVSRRSEDAVLNWSPLPEEIMRDSGPTSDNGSLWSALSRTSSCSTVYTINADRRLNKATKLANNAFKNHAWNNIQCPIVDQGGLTDPCADEITADWDPMASAYFGEGNNANMDDECAETVFTGLRNTDETRLCKFYRVGKTCPRGEICKFEHQRLRNGITTEKEPIFHSCMEMFELPKLGTLTSVIVTSVVSPSHFYVYFPHGVQDLRSSVEVSDYKSETLEKLMDAMNKHYQYSLPLPKVSLPAIGELKVVYAVHEGDDNFSRARVLETKRDSEKTYVNVFLIDYGETVWVEEQQLRNLVPQFLHLPPQAVQCFLDGVEKPEEGWGESATNGLQRLTEDISLVAHITNIISIEGPVGVKLYNTSGESDVDINAVFKKIMNL